MVLLKLIDNEIGINFLMYSISESLRTTRVDELKLPLIVISNYLAPIWSTNKYEVITILNQFETETRPDRIQQSLTHQKFLPISEQYPILSQRYSDYIEFLGFKKIKRENLKSRFETIHTDFILPKPRTKSYQKVKLEIITEKKLLEQLLFQEADIARLEKENQELTKLNSNKQSVQKKSQIAALLTYSVIPK